MKTLLDTAYELELVDCRYSGDELVAEVAELSAELSTGRGHRLLPTSRRFRVRFEKPFAHVAVEQAPAAMAGMVLVPLAQARETGFLRRVEVSVLRAALGLNMEPFDAVPAYLLITVHELLVVFCHSEPSVHEIPFQEILPE